MIGLTKLIAHYSVALMKDPPKSPLDQRDINLSTLTYLNAHRVTIAMLKVLAKDAADLEAEARLP